MKDLVFGIMEKIVESDLVVINVNGKTIEHEPSLLSMYVSKNDNGKKLYVSLIDLFEVNEGSEATIVFDFDSECQMKVKAKVVISDEQVLKGQKVLEVDEESFEVF